MYLATVMWVPCTNQSRNLHLTHLIEMKMKCECSNVYNQLLFTYSLFLMTLFAVATQDAGIVCVFLSNKIILNAFILFSAQQRCFGHARPSSARPHQSRTPLLGRLAILSACAGWVSTPARYKFHAIFLLCTIPVSMMWIFHIQSFLPNQI